MSERHVAPSAAEQQLVHDLVQDRLTHLFGPGGSFRVTVGRPTQDDAVFVSTIVDTLAHDIAAAFSPSSREPAGRRVARTPREEHESLWKTVDAELKLHSSGPNAFLDDIEAEPAPIREDDADADARVVDAA